MIFYDYANLSIDIPDSLEQICRKAMGAPFDHEKMYAIAASLILLQSRRASLKISVIAHQEPAFLPQIHEAAQIVFGEQVATTICTTSEFCSGEQRDIDLLIIAVNDEVSRLAIYDKSASYMASESFIFFDSFFDYARHEAMVSVDAQISRLERHGFARVRASYYCLMSRGFDYFGGMRQPTPASIDVQARSLFIYGCERSGTSLLVQLLNARSDIFVTFEANWYQPKYRASAVANFNKMAEVYGKPLDKGSYLPAWISPELTTAELFGELQKHYALVGDKLAFAPRDARYETPASEAMMHFIEEQFPFSRILLTSREPVTSLFASSKIRPNKNITYIFDNWLLGIIKTLHTLMVNDRTVLMPHDRLCRKSILPLQQLTGLDFSAFLELIDWSEVTSRHADAEIFIAEKGQPHTDAIREAALIYGDFLAAVPEAGRPRTKTQREGVQSCYRRFQSLYNRFAETATW